jgi:hypothetical protein
MSEEAAAGREIHAGLELLDRQIIDCNGCMAGNVDDLELEVPEESGALPVVTAILSGPGALAGQLGGRLGKWLASVQQRLHHQEDPGPARIAFSVVKRINDHVEVSVPRESLDSNAGERWARDVIIDKIPGARHEAE